MKALPADHDDRQGALRDVFDRLATDLLSEREPENEVVGRLLLIVTDAALRGDRSVLARVEELVSRLDFYLDGEAVWANELRGRLWAVGHLASLSYFLAPRGSDRCSRT